MRFLRRNRLNNPAQGLSIAEDDELAGIFDNRKTSALHFVKERPAADKAFDIPHFSPDHATLTGCLRRK